MKHQKLKPIIFCSNPGLILTYFKARSILQLRLLYGNVTMMDSLEIIAYCDLKFGLYSKLNVK